MRSDFRVALFIPDGVALRNFVLGRFLEELAPEAEVDLYHNLPPHLAEQYAAATPEKVTWQPILEYSQSRAVSVLQSCLAYAHMYWANTHSMRRAVSRPVRAPLKTQMLVQSCRLVGRMSADPRRIEWMDALHFSLVRRHRAVDAYKRLFDKTKPSVVFSGCQRPFNVLPAILAAKELGIPTATFIVSWDNLSSKGRIVAPYDHYLVWSANMRRELLQYCPHVRAENVHIVGTPQFDPYQDAELLWDRAEFFRRIGGDPDRPLICFSGGDAGTCPEDPEHVRILLEMIRSGKIRGNPQVLVRPSPVDDGKRYDAVRRNFPELIFLLPAWTHARPGDWTRVTPSAEDVQFLTNLVHYSDMNVNLGSTMTLDFGLHDKPVVNVAFDVADPPLFGMPVYDYYYKYEHFRPVVEFGASRIARKEDQLPGCINAYLENPALDREGRRRLVDLHVDVPPGQSSRAAVAALMRIGRAESASPQPDAALAGAGLPGNER
jgi:hypothetical protein